MREQACFLELLVPTRLEAWGWSHALEKTQHTQHLKAEEECIMVGYLQPCGLFVSLPDMQVLDGGHWGAAIALRGFALGMITGMEKLCLLCPGYRKPTAEVGAWMKCGYCE